jgi:putative hydrolase of the HAD superfamily
MKASETCLVLDLDDTLYPEFLYQKSGFEAVELVLRELFGLTLDVTLLELSKSSGDVFEQVCERYGLKQSVKEELINVYRFHAPSITLSDDVLRFVISASKKFKAVAILTDGRSVTQRLKLKSLGLLHLPVYISDDWGSAKPDDTRFKAIEKKCPSCETFCYVGDNLKKDFIAPNNLGWFSVCIRDKGFNIHPQVKDGLPEINLPKLWLDSVSELDLVFE